MTAEKIRSVVAMYHQALDELNVPELSCPHDGTPDEFAALAHCHAMLDEIDAFVGEGRLEKAFCWLGFVQGCLWTCGVYSIAELKDHNRP